MKPALLFLPTLLLSSPTALYAADKPTLQQTQHFGDPKAGHSFTNSIGIKLVRIEAGTFTMGQDGPPLEDYLQQKRFVDMHKDIDRIDFDEKPAHPVTISQPFMMGVTEVTVAQYRRFEPRFKTNDPKSTPAGDDAASGVTWEKASLSSLRRAPLRLRRSA